MKKEILFITILLLCTIGVTAQSYSGNVVAFYPFNETGTTAVDYVGGYNLTLSTANLRNTSSLPSGSSGSLGNGSLSSGNVTFSKIPDISTIRTISFWIRPTSTVGQIIMNNASNSNDLYYDGANRLTRCTAPACAAYIQVSATNTSYTSATHIIISMNSSTRTVYYNGTAQSVTVSGSPSQVMTHNATFFQPGTFFKGVIDNLCILSTMINGSQATELFNNENAGYGCLNLTTPIDTFNISALNAYNSTALSNFSAVVNGTYYSTSNGSIDTNLTSSQLVNITVNATNYFPRTYENQNLSSDLIANLTPYTAIYASSLVGGNISISSFSLNVTNSSGTTTLSTTNGVIFVPLFNSTWNFTLFDAFNSTYNFTSDNTSLTGNPYLQEYRFYLYASNTFNIIFRDELNNSIIYTPSGNSSLIQVEFIGDAFSYNFTANGTLTAELLIPQDYVIRYQKDGYGRLRQYFVTLTNQTVQNLTLYMLLDSESEDLTVTVYEQTTLVRVPGSVVYLQRFNVSTNSYSTVAMYETDVAGNAYFDVQRNDELYKFQVDYPWGTSKFVSEAFYIESSEINLYISTISGFTEGFFEQSGIQGTITYSSSPNTFTLSYSDPSSTATQYCFSIKQWNRYAKEILNQSCSSSASGSISLTGFTEDGTYYGVFTATIDGTEQVIATSWKDLVTDELDAGAFGILLTLGLFLTFIFIFPWHTYAAILGSVALIFARLFGIFPIDWGYIIAILIASILLGALLENRR